MIGENVLRFSSRSGDTFNVYSKNWFDVVNNPLFIGINTQHRSTGQYGSGVCRINCYTTPSSFRDEVNEPVPDSDK